MSGYSQPPPTYHAIEGQHPPQQQQPLLGPVSYVAVPDNNAALHTGYQQQPQQPQPVAYVQLPPLQPHYQPQPVQLAPAGAGVVVVVAPPADGLQTRAFDQHIATTYSPERIDVIHRQTLSRNWICYQCNPLCAPCAIMAGDLGTVVRQLTGQALCDYLCWDDKLAPRAYAAVHENRVEFNYPFTSCCGLCVNDRVVVQYFDQIGDMRHETCCTPFHFLFCIECFGGVMARAPCYAVNCACCACCRCYYPGLSDGVAFNTAYQQASAAAKTKQRVVHMNRH